MGLMGWVNSRPVVEGNQFAGNAVAREARFSGELTKLVRAPCEKA